MPVLNVVKFLNKTKRSSLKTIRNQSCMTNIVI